MKKTKKPNVPKLKRKAFKLWSEKVRNAYGNKCAICGGEKMINAHHIESRKNISLRFDVCNGAALCPTHHKFGIDSAHNSPVWFDQWMRTNRPLTIDYILQHRCDKVDETPEYMMIVMTKLQQPATQEELAIMGVKNGIPTVN